MTKVRTTELGRHVGERVSLSGWLHSIRRMGGVSFVVLRDGYGLAQAVTENEADLDPLGDAGVESIIELEGRVVSSEHAADGVELHDPRLVLREAVTEAPPVVLSKRELRAQLQTLLDHATVANRHPKRRALFRISAGVMWGFREALDNMGFTEIQTPKIVASSTESGADVFTLDYFGTPAFLAQSPQLY